MVGSAGVHITPLWSGNSAAVGSLKRPPIIAQPEPSLASRSVALARLSTPDLFGSAMSLSWIQKKPLATTTLASAARSFLAPMSTSCLRNVWKLASSYGAGGLAATGVYGLIGGGGGGFSGNSCGACWPCADRKS